MKTTNHAKKIAAALVAALMLAGGAFAQDYPSRRITVLVGFPAGGGIVDVSMHLLADKLKARFNQPVIIEYRPGNGSQLSLETVSKAPPDGYLLALGTIGLATLKLTNKSFTLDPLKDFTYVGQFVSSAQPLLIIASAKAPYKTLGELISYARANPGKVSFGAVGSSMQMEVGLLESAAGFKATTVLYKGSTPMDVDLTSGELGASIGAIASSKASIEAGRVRILAVGSRERTPDFPGVPAVSEMAPGYEMTPFWFGIVGPPNMPANLVSRLNEAINGAMREPDAAARLATVGLKPVTGSPADFRAFVVREQERFAKAASLIGLQPQ